MTLQNSISSFFALAILLFMLCGCSTLPDSSHCSGGTDWLTVGRIDGREGRKQEFVNQQSEICSEAKISVDRERYAEGWRIGNREYCTPEVGYDVGVTGRIYLGVCDADTEPEFTRAYAKGREANLLKGQIAETEKSIEETRKRADDDRSVLADVGRVWNLLTNQSPTTHLENEKSTLQSKLREVQGSAPASVSYLNDESRTLENSMNYGGAVIGATMGFGLGHTFQGRFGSEGWKWAVIDIATVALVGTFAEECWKIGAPSDENSRTRLCQDPVVNAVPLVGFLVSRTLQATDLWRYARSKANPYVGVTLPEPDETSGLSLGFNQERGHLRPSLIWMGSF